MIKFRYLALVLALLCSCQNTDSKQAVVSDAFAAAEQAYKSEKSQTTANKFIDQILSKIADNPKDKSQIIALSENAYNVAKENNLVSKQRGFLFSLIKEDYGNSSTPSRISELAGQMTTIKRAGTANILYKSLIDNFQNTPEAVDAQKKLDPAVSNIPQYIVNIGEGIFKGEVDKFGINRNAALRYVDACEAYALSYPETEDAASHLFRAAEIAKSIQTFPKLMSLYDWIIDRYPNYEKTPTTLFLKGFVLENDLKNDEKAKEVYDHFIATYPNHELRDDVEFLLENLGKTDEEIRQIIEAKQQNKEQ